MAKDTNNYIIYNIAVQECKDPKGKQPYFDFDKVLKDGKSLVDFLNEYISQCIGKEKSSIHLYKKKGKEQLEGSAVVSHENGIIVIRIHNPKWDEIYLKPEEYEILPQSRDEKTFPYAYAVIDCRENGRCQMAIECAPAFGYSTNALKNCFNEFFSRNLGKFTAQDVIVTEKYFPQKSLEFIKEHMNKGDSLTSLTFRYDNADANVERYPRGMKSFIQHHSDLLNDLGASFGETNMEFPEGYKEEKLEQLGLVIAYSKDRGYDIGVKFRESGAYTLGGNGVVAKFPMHTKVIDNIINGKASTHPTKCDDIGMWLDHVSDELKG